MTAAKWIVILCFFSAIGVYCAEIPDSLSNEFNKEKSSLEKYDRAVELVQVYGGIDIELANYCAEKELQYANVLGDSLKISLAFDDLGEVNRKLGNYKKAEEYLNSALTIKLSLNEEEAELHTTYNILGKTYANWGEYDKSAENFLLAVDEMDKIGNLEGKAFYLNNVGIVFDLQGIYEKAIVYYQKSLEIKKKLNMTDAFAASYTNIGVALYNKGDINQSLEYHKMALSENERMGKTESIARSSNNIGFAYLELKDYQKALPYFFKAYEIRKRLKDVRAIAQTANNISMVYTELDNLDSALFFVNIALESGNQSESRQILRDIYQVQSRILEKKGDFEGALISYQKYAAINDTLKNEDVYEKVVEMEAKYNLSEKEKQILVQNFQIETQKLEYDKERSAKIFYILLLIFSVVLVILIFLLYLNRRRRSELLKAQLILIQTKNNQLTRIKEELSVELQDKKVILDKVFTSKKTTKLPPELLELSKREMEVLSYLALGWTDQQIAEKLFVSRSTVKTHLRRIYSKLLVKGRAGAVSIAHQYDIIGSTSKLDQGV